MCAEVIQFPGKNEKPWEGDPTQSRRWTDHEGLVVEDGGEEAYADMWVENLGLPPRLPGELWHQWAARTAEERNVGSAVPAEKNEQETA